MGACAETVAACEVSAIGNVQPLMQTASCGPWRDAQPIHDDRRRLPFWNENRGVFYARDCLVGTSVSRCFSLFAAAGDETLPSGS